MTRLARAKAAVVAALSKRGLKATPLAVNALAESLRYSDPSYLGDTDTLLAGLLLSGSYTVDVLEQSGVDRRRLRQMALASVRGVSEWDDHSNSDAFAEGFSQLSAGAELLAKARAKGTEIHASDILRVALKLDDAYMFGDSAAAFPRELRKDAPPTSPLLIALEDRLCEIMLLTASYLSAPRRPTMILRRRTRPISGKEDELLDKEFGSLFRGMKTEELEFIIRAMNSWFVNRSLPLHPASLCLQTINRCADLLYGPRFVAESGGDLAAVEAGLALSHRLAPSHDEPFLAMFQRDGRIYANHFTYQRSLLVPNMAKDRSHDLQGARLYTPRPLPIVSPDILAAFSRLISGDTPDRAGICEFLRSHPDIVESLGYCRAAPQFCLRDVDSAVMSPDFVLDIPGRRAHAFLRLSSPAQSPVVRDPYVRASSELLRAISHLREFGNHFESRSHRNEIEKEYGMTGFRPEVIVLIGRSSMFHTEPERMSFEKQLEAGVRVLTYDDVVSYAKTRSLPHDTGARLRNLEGIIDDHAPRSAAIHVGEELVYEVRGKRGQYTAESGDDFAFTTKPPNDWPSDVSYYKGKTRAAIVTIKPEEEDAILAKFPPAKHIKGRRSYNLCGVTTDAGKRVLISTVRLPRQGNLEAQAVVSEVIDDLAPDGVLLVGIGGASPFGDAVLGDVVFGTYVHDLTVTLDSADGTRQFAGAGGPMTDDIVSAVTHLRPILQSAVKIEKRPALNIDSLEFTTSDEQLNGIIRERLRDRFDMNYASRIWTGPILSSDALVKNPELARQWCDTRRDALAIDMEFAGAYRASRGAGRSSALIAIRGISDIVGHKKSEGWVRHACMVAAEFAHGFVMRWEP